jgi:triosephosphate isomerase (TIM)
MVKAQKKTMFVANWKMNPDTLEQAKELYKALDKAAKRSKATIVIAPPTAFLAPLVKKDGVPLSAQDVSNIDRGSLMGQSSASEIASIGVKYAIIGHTASRSTGDTDAIVSEKVRRALDAGLTVILCVGETERDANARYLAQVKEQVTAVYAKLDKKSARSIIIAYEPVWQVGKSFDLKIAPRDIHEMAIYIKKTINDIMGKEVGMKTAILYGGSTHPDNVGDILRDGGIDGLLIGRSSLEPEAFSDIISNAGKF